MTWNWQQPGWPKFAWKSFRLAAAEQQFLIGGGTFVGAIKHLGEDDRNHLTVEEMSTEAVTTSEIEGEILDRSSVQSSIQKIWGMSDATARSLSPCRLSPALWARRRFILKRRHRRRFQPR